MQSMTGIERIHNILKRKPVDRIGLYEQFWGDTKREWVKGGFIKEDEYLEDHFGFDLQLSHPFNYMADIDFRPLVIEETEETRLIRDGNGALLRWHKLHDSTPEHVDFMIKEREQWDEQIKPLIKADPRRIDFEAYRREKRHATDNNRFFACASRNVFEIMHPLCGHEYLLMGMALDPDWVKDMVDTYSSLIVELQEILFEKEGYPDGIWYYEDMGFKEHAFMSPSMYKEILQPGHKKTMSYAKSLGKPVITHSCGYIEPLLPGLIEAGIDCLQVIEVKAGMDLLKLYNSYGDVLSFMGGIDVRTLYTNDKSIIDRELEVKVPEVMKKFGYVLHSDHSIPNTVNYETYKYFIERGLELGTYR